MGRVTGSRNRGYFYRDGRGWYTQIAEPLLDETGQPRLDAKGKPLVKRRFVALRDDSGKPLRIKTTSISDVKAAYQRIVANPGESENGEGVTVQEVCDAYLNNIADGASYKLRRDILFDFCTGYPPRFRGKELPPGERLHKGYAARSVAGLRPLDIDQWIQAHKWTGGKRTKIQAIQRALNYGVECGLIPATPLKGFKVPTNKARVTYVTPEQENALLANASPAMAVAIKVLIRTGARPGSEFAALTAKQVVDDGQRMEWRFKEVKRKPRVIRIKDPEVIAAVRERLENKGPIFRSSQGSPWQLRNLSHRFRLLKAKAEKNGIQFDDDCVLYSLRHTYAKRILQGYWSGKPTNIETLARLMGNTPQVCQAHYLQWCESYNEPLWDNA
jgi:integrase